MDCHESVTEGREVFFLFERHAQILCRASKLLLSGLHDGYDGVCRIQPDISMIEDEGDHVVHDIFGHLRATFITPFDPEDIQALATSLDDVLDGIDDVTFRIVAYRLKPIPPAVILLAEKVDSCCSLSGRSSFRIASKEARRQVSGIEINRQKTKPTNWKRNLMADLFSNEKGCHRVDPAKGDLRTARGDHRPM